MVIYDFDFVDVFAFPTKAEAPLVIDANAVLTSYNLSKCNAVLSQRFVAVVGYSRRRARLQRRGEREFPSGGLSRCLQFVRRATHCPQELFPCLLSMASGTTRVAFVIRRHSSQAQLAHIQLRPHRLHANPAVPMPQARRQLGEPLLLARRFVFGQPRITVMPMSGLFRHLRDRARTHWRSAIRAGQRREAQRETFDIIARTMRRLAVLLNRAEQFAHRPLKSTRKPSPGQRHLGLSVRRAQHHGLLR